MTQRVEFVTLGELLDERADSEVEEDILSRLKILARESLPVGWIRWEVSRLAKEEVIGDEVEATVLDKLTFALPTVGIVRAFDPEAEHLSEIGYRHIRLKLLDWAFTRALIIGPPAIANRIRGSASRTELFKETIAPMRYMLHTRREADVILRGGALAIKRSCIKRRYTSTGTETSQPKKSRIAMLEERMEKMFSLIAAKIESITTRPSQSFISDSNSEMEEEGEDEHERIPESEWHAPSMTLE